MTKFKIGDLVKITEGYTGYPSGSPYNLPRDPGIIVDIGEGWVTIRWKDIISPPINPDVLKSIEYESPVKTVYRKEIVPGIYGRIAIKKLGNFPAIRVVDESGKYDSGTSYYLNAKELRDAAKIFNDLAEFLEETT